MEKKDKKLIKERLERVGFARYLGIQITELHLGYARGEFQVREEFLNPMESVHGGCIYALADTVSGIAAATHGYAVVTTSGDMQFIRAAVACDKLIAEAKELKYGKTIAVYDIIITDGHGKTIAHGTFSFFRKKTKVY